MQQNSKTLETTGLSPLESPQRHLFDSRGYQIFTDGSCDHKDGIMGYAAVAYDPSNSVMIYRGGASTGGSVRRSEMHALLLGLQMVGEFSGLLDPSHRKTLVSNSAGRPVVLWYTDRQDVAYSITPPDGAKPFKRGKDADLWAQISWWESWVKIKAMHVPRNTVGAQTECDRVAGVLRKTLQEKVRDWAEDDRSPTILQ